MKPLNSYVQIEPETHQDFIASVNTTYDEIGVVIQVADGIHSIGPGDKVYFDSWMASKFPAGEGKHYWLVPFENIKAYERSLSKIEMQRGVSTQVLDHGTITTWTPGEVPKMRAESVLPIDNTKP